MNAQRSRLLIKASTALILLASTACSNSKDNPTPSTANSTSPAPSTASSTSPALSIASSTSSAPSTASSPQQMRCKVGDTPVYVYDRSSDKKSYKPRYRDDQDTKSRPKTGLTIEPGTELTIVPGTEDEKAIAYTTFVKITKPLEGWINKKSGNKDTVECH